MLLFRVRQVGVSCLLHRLWGVSDGCIMGGCWGNFVVVVWAVSFCGSMGLLFGDVSFFLTIVVVV